jgi:hypothetical protein
MNGSARRSLAAIAIMGLLLQSTVDGSSIVRGRLFRVTPQGQSYPASGIAVSVSHPKYKRSSYVYSGADGMFYLYNIPAGAFTLEVWTSKGQAMTFKIQVYEREYTDLAPIRLP